MKNVATPIVRRVVIPVACLFLLVTVGCRRPAAKPEAVPPPDRVVRVLNWEDYISPAALSNFTATTGIRVEYQEFQTGEELIAMVRSDPSRADVIVVEDVVIEAFLEMRLLHKVDPQRVPNATNINPRYRGRVCDPDDGYCVPYHWGTTLLAYRKDRIAEEPRSWNALWNEAYAGRIMMLGDAQEIAGVTVLSLGYKLGDISAEVIAEIKGKVLEQVPLVLRYTDTRDIQRALISGECWIASIYSGDAAQAALKEENIGYLVPEEGAPLWIDSFAIPRGAQNLEEAHAFINFMCEPAVAADNANYVRYATANEAALPLIDADLKADRIIYPSDVILDRCDFYPKFNNARERLYNTIWSEIRKRQRELREDG